MMVKTIKFNKNYKKLTQKSFTTIRLHDKYEIGDLVTVKSPSMEFKAVILHKMEWVLKDLSNEFLCQDTEKETRGEALKLLRECYDVNIRESGTVYVYWLTTEGALFNYAKAKEMVKKGVSGVLRCKF